MATVIWAHRSVAVPWLAALVDWVQAPGVSENEVAFTDPVLVMLTLVVTVWPGVIVVLPPYLLMVEQVAELVETDRHPCCCRSWCPGVGLAHGEGAGAGGVDGVLDGRRERRHRGRESERQDQGGDASGEDDGQGESAPTPVGRSGGG